MKHRIFLLMCTLSESEGYNVYVCVCVCVCVCMCVCMCMCVSVCSKMKYDFLYSRVRNFENIC